MTDDVQIVVGIKGDDSGGRAVKKTLDDIGVSGDKATNSTKNFGVKQSEVNRIIQAGLSPLEKLQAEQANYNKYLAAGAITQQQYAKATANNQAAVEKLNSSTSKLNGILSLGQGLFAAYIGAQSLKAVASISDQYTMLGARLKNITGSTNEAASAMKSLQRISAETGTSIEASLDIMQRLSFVRTEIGATNKDMLNFTETVSKLGVMSGASSDALKFGLTQLGQSLSSQIMRAEEFNSIMENIPGVGKAIADQFGVTTGQLRQLVINGSVLSKDVFAAILNQTDEVNKAMAEMPKTIERAGKEAGITFDTLVAKVMNTTNASQGYVKIIEFGNDRLKEMVATVDIIRQSFEFMGNRISVTFNNIAYEIQQLYNQASVAISDMTRGRVNMGIKSDVFKLGYSQTLEQFNTAKANAVRAAMGDTYGPNKPQETRTLSRDYAAIADKLGTGNGKLTKEQREAQKAQKKLQDELTDAVKDSRSETEKLYDKIAEQERLRPFAKTAEQVTAISKNIKNAQDELEKLRIKAELDGPMGKAFKSLAKELDGDFKDAFKSAFTASDGGFKKLIDGWKNAFKNFLADLAYQAAVRPILVSLVGGVGGAMGISQSAIASVLGTAGKGGAASGGGIGSLFSTGASVLSAGKFLLSGGSSTLLTAGLNRVGNLLGIGGVGANGPVSLSSYSSFTNGSFGGTLGAGAGAFGGNLLGNAVFGGNRGIGSSIGGAIGGFAGSFIPVPILGPMVGSFVGNYLGGLFGNNKPSDMSQWGSVNFETLAKTTGGLGGKKFSAQNATARDTILNQIAGVLGLVKEYGGSATGSAAITIGNRDGLRYNGQNFGRDVNSFTAKINEDLRKSITGLDKTFTTILDKMGVGGSSVESLTSAFQFGQSYNETLAAARPVTETLAESIKLLNDNMSNLITTAVNLGLPIDKYTEALQKQKDAAVGALKAQAAGFQSLEDMTAAFNNFFNGQALGANSSLSPMGKLQVAQSQFGDLLKKAQGGDLSVTQNLLSSANSLLDVGRDVYASGVDFSGLEAFVRSSVQGVASQAGYTGQNVSYSIVSTNQLVADNVAGMRNDIQSLKAELFRLTNKLAAAA